MLEERTNLYRVVAQTLLWIQGTTSLRYEVKSSRITRDTQQDETYYSFEVVTNQIRIGGIQHPLALVINAVHVIMNGTLVDLPEWVEINDDGIMEIEIEQMPELFLRADNSGYNNITAQTVMNLRGNGGQHTMPRHFLFNNNMIYQIR